MEPLEQELKALIIEVLDLEDITVEDINPDEPLFVDGLGLDSIDALELGVAIQKKYSIKIEAEGEQTRESFSSVKNLARFITENKK